MVINPAVCEGCGDCGVHSHCLSILPLEPALGRKLAALITMAAHLEGKAASTLDLILACDLVVAAMPDALSVMR
jgi:hypothetical protein